MPALLRRLARLTHPPRWALSLLGCLALGGWLAWLGAGTWHFHHALMAAPAAYAPPSAAAQAPAQPVDAVLVALLFGVLLTNPEAPAEDAAASLSLTLLASLVEQRAEHSRALIAGPGGSAFYRVGEQLPNGAVLRDITPDHVRLQHAGREFQLGFPRRETRLFVPRPPAADIASGARPASPETQP